MASTELYRDDFYLVRAHGSLGHPTSVVGFSGRSEEFHPLRPTNFDHCFLNDQMADWPVKANWISITSSRNCWYLADEVEPAMEVVRQAVAGTRTITYGSSMGGYAAINWARTLRADYFFAISPLFSLFDPFMASIKDNRFALDRRLLSPARETISKGLQAQQKGLVAYDDQHIRDSHHARMILRHTLAKGLTVPQAGHPCGPTLRRTYPLRLIIEALIRDDFKLKAVQREILRRLAPQTARVAPGLPTLPEVLEKVSGQGTTMGPDDWLLAVEIVVQNLASLGPEALPRLEDLARALQASPAMGEAPRRRKAATLRICEGFKTLGEVQRMEDYASAYLNDSKMLRGLLTS